MWNYLKHHGVAKPGLRSGKELKKYVLARLRSLQRLPWTIRMFFLTPKPSMRRLYRNLCIPTYDLFNTISATER